MITVEQAIEDIANGKMVIIVDDEDRENEGDICIAAEFVTPEIINFMATEARGLICVPMMASRLRELQLGLMVQENTARLTTAFTVSVDAVKDVSTGISVHDRAATVKSLIDPETKPEDLARPGHIFPLKYCEGGVLVRAGQTEAIVDLATIAGKYPAGVICEVMSEDGTMSRLPELERFSKKHSIGIVTVAQIIEYRRNHEKIIERVAEARIPTIFGEFEAISYRSIVDKDEHVALVMGDVTTDESTLVRVHSECLTSDVFSSLRCDCGEQLNLALEMIGKEGRGVFLYMRQEGRGIGLVNKLKAYNLQDEGMDTVEANIALGFNAELRDYSNASNILRNFGIERIRLLTNNPSKVEELEKDGFEVEQVAHKTIANKENKDYLETKASKMNHKL